MANKYNLSLQSDLKTEVATLQFNRTLSVTPTSQGYDAKPLSVQSDADGWTQYSKPAEMADIKALVIYNPSTNTNNVRVALTAAATYVTDEIAPGDWIKKAIPAAASIYISHKGGTGTTQNVEILAVPS